MKGWLDGFQDAIGYIEDNLEGGIEMSEAARRALVSEFYFQRIFGALCGMSVGEYVRLRRLSLAAQELSRGELRVIDAAVKYGYDSPDSFSRAFARFHGISPSAAKEQGARLKSLAPIRLKLTLEGGSIMEYRIEKKEQFTVVGVSRRFSTETSYSEIPKFWDEHYAAGGGERVMGKFGICLDSKDVNNGAAEFEYLIADEYDPCRPLPEGCITRVIPAGTWAVFPCRGALPEALQSVNTRIWSEWLPNCREYELAGNYNIEMYTPPAEKPEDTYSEIWIPVAKKN